MKASYLIAIFALLALSLFGWSQSTPLSCSPAPCALPTVQVSEGGNPVTDDLPRTGTV
jgi:hypothetical protein